MNRSGQAHECPVMAGRGLVCGFVLVWLAHSAAQAMMGEHVEARLRGEWIPAKAAFDSSWTIALDGSKKKPALSVAIGKPEKLGARFPLGDKALKKCS